MQVRTIAFHFLDRGDYINVKHRTLDKRFTLHPKGELIPWNIDALINKPICYITEGEIDALTLIQCGYLETISVPNGAQKNLSFLDPYVETHLEDKIRIVLALDNDERGIVLRNELIRRLDPERCQLVEWPEGCKDANDVLMRYGEQRVRECIEAAHDIPLVGIQTAEDVEDELWQLFRQGMQRGAAAKIAGMDELITFETGRYMVVSGRPGDGKSEFIDELCLRMALLHDWRVAYFSPENVPVTYHLRKLCEKLTRYPFQPSPSSPTSCCRLRQLAHRQRLPYPARFRRGWSGGSRREGHSLLCRQRLERALHPRQHPRHRPSGGGSPWGAYLRDRPAQPH